jgi:hypothetical protein
MRKLRYAANRLLGVGEATVYRILALAKIQAH